MAKKTVIRQMLSKWGIMSVEMQEAYTIDQAEIEPDGTYNYVDANTVEEQQTLETGTKTPQLETTPEEEPEEQKELSKEELIDKHLGILKDVDF